MALSLSLQRCEWGWPVMSVTQDKAQVNEQPAHSHPKQQADLVKEDMSMGHYM